MKIEESIIKKVFYDKTINPEKKDEFYVSINTQQELYAFAEYFKNDINFKDIYLSNYFKKIKGYINYGFGIPFYIQFINNNGKIDINHQGWDCLSDEKEKRRLENNYKHWKDDSIPFFILLNSNEYPEYFI